MNEHFNVKTNKNIVKSAKIVHLCSAVIFLVAGLLLVFVPDFENSGSFRNILVGSASVLIGIAGIYGYFFRHCNTLPLSADHRAFRELRDAITVLLGRGEKILIYPEQGMWWNYRKPRPLKAGAFHFAAANKAPVLPFFLTMEDTDRIGADGYPIQAYTVHILPAIEPDAALSVRENAQRMCDRNYAAWKDVYEQFYGIPLTYTTEQ